MKEQLRMIRIALVGLGGFGWQLLGHIRKVEATGRCRVVAAADSRLADLRNDSTRELSEAGVELFDDAVRMMDALRGKCECIYIATGISAHAPVAVAAARRGYHIHVEKPPAATVQEVDSMIRAVDEAGVCCIVGFQAMHSGSILFVKDRIVSGRLGKVRNLTCRAGWPRSQPYYDRNEWSARLRGGDAWVLDGPANNALAHQITNMLLLASPQAGGYATPTSVRGELYVAGPRDSHDTAAIEFRTAEGATARFLCSHRTLGHFGPTIEIECDGGVATWAMSQSAEITYADGSRESCDSDITNQSVTMVGNLMDAVESGDPSLVRCKLTDARKMTLVIDGAHESSRRIHRIDGQSVRTLDEGTDEQRIVVEDIDDAIIAAADTKALFSDLSDAPPWAVATQPYDVSGYDTFPQQFEPDA